jgi:hypothetical protein
MFDCVMPTRNARNAHLFSVDNARGFPPPMADALCIASTGGALTGRQLYSDADEHVLQLHCAVVLNGIHSLVDQPDLAQRCLQIEVLPLPEVGRKPEAQMQKEFATDLPAIQRGLYDLTAQILKFLPDAKVTNPERMLDFVHWLAAMEMAEGAPSGVYQEAYSYAVHQGQRDSVLDDVLAAAVLEFAERTTSWSGTPQQLLTALAAYVPSETKRSRQWPATPIALSKRLRSFEASLLTQRVRVSFSRGKERAIDITMVEAA